MKIITVKVEREGSKHGYAVINESDQAETDVLFEEEASSEEPVVDSKPDTSDTAKKAKNKS